MSVADLSLPQPDAVLSGPFWPGSVRVLRAHLNGAAIRIEAVGVADAQYYDRTLTLDQFQGQVSEVVGGTHRFDAEPRLFRLATEALRIDLAHAFDPQFAVSVSQVDPLPHQLGAVYQHMLPLPRIRFLLADDPGAGKTIMVRLLMRELIRRGEARRASSSISHRPSPKACAPGPTARRLSRPRRVTTPATIWPRSAGGRSGA